MGMHDPSVFEDPDPTRVLPRMDTETVELPRVHTDELAKAAPAGDTYVVARRREYLIQWRENVKWNDPNGAEPWAARWDDFERVVDDWDAAHALAHGLLVLSWGNVRRTKDVKLRQRWAPIEAGEWEQVDVPEVEL